MEPTQWPYEVEPFQCHRCGNCCRGDGFVKMTEDDLARAAALLAQTRDEFLAAHCQTEANGEILLIDQSDPLRSCIFLQPDNLCRIHTAKPVQCQGFPMKWRPTDALDLCAGLRSAAGLPPPTRRTISVRSG